MLSKIVSHGAATGRVTWRGIVKPAPIQPVASSTAVMPDELALLKARLAEVEAEAEDRIRDSYGSGLAEGRAAGRAQAEEKIGEALERLAAAVAELADARQRMLAQAESDLLKLSIEVARRILHRELTIDPDAVGALIKAAIDKLKGQMIYKVRTHPDHEAIVRSSLLQFGMGPQIEIVGDPMRAPGAIVFELESGNLDASIDAQLREIERGLADNLEREQ